MLILSKDGDVIFYLVLFCFFYLEFDSLRGDLDLFVVPHL